MSIAVLVHSKEETEGTMKKIYVSPKVRIIDHSEILKALGPASTCTSPGARGDWGDGHRDG